jgi:corrinoid protein of di/trimethylamine methyltransferase
MGKLCILDGAMGTMIQQYRLDEEAFRGARFANHPTDLKGCNDVLSLTAPFIIRDIHRKYLEAGADIIETNTFNAQRISLQDYGLADHVRDINIAAAKIARQCADEFSSPDKPRYVAGSIGPTSRTTSVATSGEPLPEDDLRAAYKEQIEALRDGGVNVLLIETIFDVENARIAIETASTIAPDLPIMLSFSVATPDGHNMLGQDIVSFIDTLNKDDIFSIGINCTADVPGMTPLVRRLAHFGTRVSFYPNAGLPVANGSYGKSPESLVADLWPLLEGHHLNIIGGCCGTTNAHIACITRAVEPIPGLRLSPLTPRIATDAVPKNDDIIAGNTVLGDLVAESSTVSTADSLFTAILNGKSDDAAAATREAIAQDISPQDLINGQMIRAMSEVGQRFQDGKAFVPQLLMAGRAMKAALEILKPMMAGSASTSLGKVVIGTVKGDLHDIGKNLVASMLEGCGFEVVNIGIDVSADTFIEAVKENQPDILCMSALLTTTMGYMKDVIDALEAAGIRDQVKVMVGGAPVTQGFADEIGADGYSDNANSAVTVAKQLLGKL